MLSIHPQFLLPFFSSAFPSKEVKLLINICSRKREFVLHLILLPCKALPTGLLSLDKACSFILYTLYIMSGNYHIQGTWFTYRYSDITSEEWRRNGNTERNQNIVIRCDQAFFLLFLFPSKKVSHGDFFFQEEGLEAWGGLLCEKGAIRANKESFRLEIHIHVKYLKMLVN